MSSFVQFILIHSFFPPVIRCTYVISPLWLFIPVDFTYIFYSIADKRIPKGVCRTYCNCLDCVGGCAVVESMVSVIVRDRQCKLTETWWSRRLRISLPRSKHVTRWDIVRVPVIGTCGTIVPWPHLPAGGADMLSLTSSCSYQPCGTCKHPPSPLSVSTATAHLFLCRLQTHPACPTPLEKKKEKNNTKHVMASHDFCLCDNHLLPLSNKSAHYSGWQSTACCLNKSFKIQ